MRLVFLLALAVLVLPLSGCAKKEKDEPSTTNSNQNDSTQDNEVAEKEAAEEEIAEDAGDGGMIEGEEEFPEEAGSEEVMPGVVADAELEGAGEPEFPESPTAGVEPERVTPDDSGFEEPPGETEKPEGNTPDDSGFSESVSRFGKAVTNFLGNTPDNSGSTESEFPEEGNLPEGEGLEGESPEMPETENPEGLGDAEGVRRQAGGIPQKPTDVIRGLKEDTPPYAAIDFLLKVGRGESEGLKELIAEDADEMLTRLRSDPEKTFKEAQEIIGRWKPVSTRGDNRDTIIYFRNNKDKVLQVFVRRIQGKYRVRELREREAAKQNRRRR